MDCEYEFRKHEIEEDEVKHTKINLDEKQQIEQTIRSMKQTIEISEQQIEEQRKYIESLLRDNFDYKKRFKKILKIISGEM